MRSWTIEPSPADSTINFSRLTRESDADAGPDFSWDADTETLIIRPRENPSRVDTSDDDPPAVTTPTTVAAAAAEPGSTSSSGSATLQPTRQRQPLSNHFEAVNRHIENLQRIVRYAALFFCAAALTAYAEVSCSNPTRVGFFLGTKDCL